MESYNRIIENLHMMHRPSSSHRTIGRSKNIHTLKKKAYNALAQWKTAKSRGRNITQPRLKAAIAIKNVANAMAKNAEEAYEEIKAEKNKSVYRFSTARNMSGHTPLNMNDNTYKLKQGGTKKIKRHTRNVKLRN